MCTVVAIRVITVHHGVDGVVRVIMIIEHHGDGDGDDADATLNVL